MAQRPPNANGTIVFVLIARSIRVWRSAVSLTKQSSLAEIPIRDVVGATQQTERLLTDFQMFREIHRRGRFHIRIWQILYLGGVSLVRLRIFAAANVAQLIPPIAASYRAAPEREKVRRRLENLSHRLSCAAEAILELNENSGQVVEFSGS